MQLIVRVTRRDGSIRESLHEGTASVGRAPVNDVVLPGLLIAAQHLRITALAADRLGVDCPSSIGVRCNDGPAVVGQSEAKLGDRLKLGTWQLEVQAAGRSDALVVAITDTGSADRASRSALSLAEGGWKMRRPALIGAALVLLLCLLVPLALHWFPVPDAVSRFLPTERLWSSGPLSHGHRHLADRCESCHEKLFVSVQDNKCLTCHVGIRHHAGSDALLKETGLDQASCASCHLEHGGPHAVLPAHAATCTDCHASETRSQKWKLAGAAADFARQHPAFLPTVNSLDPASGVWTEQRAIAAETLSDDSALKFPHDLHLDPAGIRGAKGNKEVLQCQSCHQAERGAPGFPTIRFESHCQSCHALELETSAGKLKVPHGDEDSARAILQPAYDRGLLSVPEEPETNERRRPGEQAERDLDARPLTGTVDDIVTRGLCGTCHLFTGGDGTAAAKLIAPRLRQDWLVHSEFSHAPHQAVVCKDCHAAAESSRSQDLLLPPIATCRTCHTGADDSHGIPSKCIDCHRFHRDQGLPMGAAAEVKPLASPVLVEPAPVTAPEPAS